MQKRKIKRNEKKKNTKKSKKKMNHKTRLVNIKRIIIKEKKNYWDKSKT